MQYALVPAGTEIVIGEREAIEKAAAEAKDFRVFAVRELSVVKPTSPKIKFPYQRAKAPAKKRAKKA